MVMKKFSIDDYVMLSEEQKERVHEWALLRKIPLQHIHCIEQVEFEDDPILSRVNLVVWDLNHHRYITADNEVRYIFETNDSYEFILIKFAEIEVDDFPWDVMT